MATLAPCLDLGDRPRHQLVHGAANLAMRHGSAVRVEVAANLAEYDVVAGLLEVRGHDLFGVSFGLRARAAKPFCRPQAEQFVAPRVRLELELLVMGELLF